jgi:hypothetical protein
MMYTGTLIEDLIATVEGVQVRAEDPAREQSLTSWYALAQIEMARDESKLAEVA